MTLYALAFLSVITKHNNNVIVITKLLLSDSNIAVVSCMLILCWSCRVSKAHLKFK